MSVMTMDIQTDQPISTWFGVGGRAKRLASPRTVEELRACVELDPACRVLGDGANLLVADAGVEELVVSLKGGVFGEFSIGAVDSKGHATVRAGGGVHLFKLINATVDAGLSGLEELAGIPASVGGAVMMNAGGKYGSTGDHLTSVEVMSREDAKVATLKRNQVEFAYRHCGLARPTGTNPVVMAAEFRLKKVDAKAVKAKLKEVTEYKKTTQPLNANSAGCCFKNPTLKAFLQDIGTPGTRVSAGMLIDRAGCKGLERGGAVVSDQHANFLVARPGCTAGDVIALMREVRKRVEDKFGVVLEPEVVVWGEKV